MHTIHYKTKFIDNNKPSYIIEWVDDIDDTILPTNTDYKANKRKYYREVKRLTNEVDKKNIEGYDETNLLISTDIVKGIHSFKISTKLVIDHKISISYGFKNNIPAKHIAHISNLRYIPSVENQSKLANIFVDNLNEWIITKQKNIL